MLWARRPAAPAPAESAHGALDALLDRALFSRHFAELIETANPDGGIEVYLEALGAKQSSFAATLARAASEPLRFTEVEALLERAFTARRRIHPALAGLGEAAVAELIAGLVHGAGPVPVRMQRFVDAMPGAPAADRDGLRAAAKVRRAAWDFAAEIVHFGDPERQPLMTRWVWDQATQSGALREFVEGGTVMTEIPVANDPESFETVYRWLAAQIAGEGIYRDVPLWIDLVLARAYITYVKSMTDGSLGADFGRGAPAREQLKKLLGIDERPAGRSRVKKFAENH